MARDCYGREVAVGSERGDEVSDRTTIDQTIFGHRFTTSHVWRGHRKEVCDKCGAMVAVCAMVSHRAGSKCAANRAAKSAESAKEGKE